MASCSSNDDGENGPLISEATYYDLTRVGAWSTYDEASLDDIGSALCDDMQKIEDDTIRRSIVLVLNEQADDELQAYTMALAITARHCTEYFHLWDDDVEQIMGGELPWDRDE
ncbi:MAG: hypothetical protein ACRDVZ_12185 [Jiangellaceae bacterium]